VRALAKTGREPAKGGRANTGREIRRMITLLKVHFRLRALLAVVAVLLASPRAFGRAAEPSGHEDDANQIALTSQPSGPPRPGAARREADPWRAQLASTPGREAPSSGGAAPPETRAEIDYDDLDRVTQVRRYVPASAATVTATETYAYNALEGFSIFDGALVDDQRPRLDGAGKASAAVPASDENGNAVNNGPANSYLP
jgi:hypothetical protein